MHAQWPLITVSLVKLIVSSVTNAVSGHTMCMREYV